MDSASRIEAIILGSGTSNGVPMLGVEYPEEFLANPKNHRTRASLLLKGPTGNLLVDSGPEMRIQLNRERIYNLDAVLITHTHADHVMGMDDLRSLCMKTKQPVQVYTLPRYQEDIKRIFPYAFQEVPAGVWVPRFDLHDVPKVIEIGGMTVQTFGVLHGRIPVTGVRVNDFAYITDVSEIPDEARPKLQGLDILVIDAVRAEPHPNHFHFDAAMAEIERLQPRLAVLTHLSHEYDHDRFEETLPDGVILAYDGLRFSI